MTNTILLISILSLITINAFALITIRRYFKTSFQTMFLMLGSIEKRLVKGLSTTTNGKDATWLIICTFNRESYLEKTIKSIKEHEPLIKILVIDNGSEDSTPTKLVQWKNEGLVNKVLLNNYEEVPQWQKSFALSQGIRMLQLEEYEYLTWIDDDIEVIAPFLKFSKQVLKHPDALDVKIVNLLTDDTQESIHPTEKTIQVLGESVSIKKSLNGAFVFFKKSLLSEIGLPPTGEGINDVAVEDWYYSRLLTA